MINEVVLVGRLTSAPVVREVMKDRKCANFTLALDRAYDKEKTDFIPCVVWGKPAEFMEQYAEKGMLCSVCGTLNIDVVEDEKSGDVQRYTKVVCNRVNLHFPPREREEEERPRKAYKR